MHACIIYMHAGILCMHATPAAQAAALALTDALESQQPRPRLQTDVDSSAVVEADAGAAGGEAEGRRCRPQSAADRRATAPRYHCGGPMRIRGPLVFLLCFMRSLIWSKRLSKRENTGWR